MRGDAICSRGSGAGKEVIYINQTPHFFLANACCWVCKLWWDPRPKLALRAAWCEWGKSHSRVCQSSEGQHSQGSCDLDLTESISKQLEKSEDGTHCNGFHDISMAGLRTRHQRIQCIINCKHEIQQGSCSLRTQNNPPYEYSVTLSNPQKINLVFSHGLQMEGEIRECARGLFSSGSRLAHARRLTFPCCSPAECVINPALQRLRSPHRDQRSVDKSPVLVCTPNRQCSLVVMGVICMNQVQCICFIDLHVLNIAALFKDYYFFLQI